MSRVSDALARIRDAHRVEWPERIRKVRNKVIRANASKPEGKRLCGRAAVSLVARVE
jgi:hypothetical protein